MLKFCEECGAPLIENARFCNKCGWLVPENDSESQNGHVVVPDKSGNKPVNRASSLKGVMITFTVFALILQLISAVFFAFLPVYNVSVSFSVQDTELAPAVYEELEFAGAEPKVSKDYSVTELSKERLQDMEFLYMESDSVPVYVEVGVVFLCLLGVIFLIVPLAAKKPLGFGFGLPSVISQVGLICGGAFVLLRLADGVKAAMDKFLVDFAQDLSLNGSVMLEGTSAVGFSLWGFVIAGSCILSVVMTIIAVIVGSKCTKQEKTL